MIFQVDKVTVPLQKRSMNGGKISSSCPIIIFSLGRKSECDVGHLTFSHNHRDNNGELWRITHDILLAASKKGAWGQKSSSLSPVYDEGGLFRSLGVVIFSPTNNNLVTAIQNKAHSYVLIEHTCLWEKKMWRLMKNMRFSKFRKKLKRR